MKKFVWCVLLGLCTGVWAQTDSLMYRICLTDKAETTYSLERPEEFLSQKAIDRRMRQQLPVDSTDLPVCAGYVEAIRAKGVRVVATGKWENFVTVACNDSTLVEEIAALPFVKSTEKVWTLPKRERVSKRDTISSERPEVESWYGTADRQIQMNNGDKLHEAGFKGEGMTIAVIDAGFQNVDRIPLMSNIRVLGARDFVNPKGDIYGEDSHGLKVFSCMAMNQPHVLVGTAPEASYWLLRSEDARSEHLVEQDYWAAAIEFADSVGVDVVNTSLGYYKFDDPTKDYAYRDLDGNHAMMSRQASRVADKGMVLVCSAGNAGAGPWKKITPPGDAENVLTVGAIGKNGQLAPFSSVGDTADGRVKPDVVAVGYLTDLIGTDGLPAMANGTSFSSPVLCGMVTCLWQALPELTAKEIIELVRRSGDRAEFPDNIYGYGVPDFWKAYQWIMDNGQWTMGDE